MDIHERVVALAEAGQPFCLLVALSAEGSTPREAGAKAVVDATGRLFGTIGGGAVEADALRLADPAMQSGRPALLDFALDGSRAAAGQPICGGAMRVLIDPTAAKDVAAFQAATEAARTRRRGLLVTRVTGSDPVETTVAWHSEPDLSSPETVPAGKRGKRGRSLFPTIGDCLEGANLGKKAPSPFPLQACVTRGAAQFVQVSGPDGRPVYSLIEPVTPHPRILIAGGGHVGRALAAQALLLEFEIIVIDDRPEFADPAALPEGVAACCEDIATALSNWDVDDQTYIAIVTRDHHHDIEALAACIHKPAGYVGMIGSRRKVNLVRESLIGSGRAASEELDRVYAPIGLDIGAETVPEIATSILAQIIAVRRKGSIERCPTDESAS